MPAGVAPEATMTSTPAAWSATASSTVVAVPMLFAPRRRISSTMARSGTPMTKLNTGGAAQEGLDLLMERRAVAGSEG